MAMMIKQKSTATLVTKEGHSLYDSSNNQSLSAHYFVILYTRLPNNPQNLKSKKSNLPPSFNNSSISGGGGVEGGGGFATSVRSLEPHTEDKRSTFPQAKPYNETAIHHSSDSRYIS